MARREFKTEYVTDGQYAKWPFMSDYVEPTKAGYLFDGWKLNDTVHKPPYTETTFGPITENKEIKATWDKLTVLCDSNHLIIAGTGDTDSDLTKIHYWAETESGRKITESVTLETVPLDSGDLPIIFEDKGTSIDGNKNLKEIKVLENTDPNHQRFAKYRSSYNGLYSDIVLITQAANGEIVLPPFDYITFTYEWTEADGTDLDSASVIRDSNIPISGNKTLNDYYVGFMGSDSEAVSKYIQHGGDNKQSGAEGAYINWKDVIRKMNEEGILENVRTLHLDIYANWFSTKRNAKMNVVFKTYTSENGDGLVKNGFVFEPTGDTVLSTVQRIDNLTVNAHGIVNAFNFYTGTGGHESIAELRNSYSKIAEVEYNVISKTAVLRKITEVTGRDVQSAIIQVNETDNDISRGLPTLGRIDINKNLHTGSFTLSDFVETINGVTYNNFNINNDEITLSYYYGTEGVPNDYVTVTMTKSGNTYTVNWTCRPNPTGNDKIRLCDITFLIHGTAGTYKPIYSIYQSAVE